MGGATKAYKDEIEELKVENDTLAKKLGKTTIERDWLQGKLNSLVSLKNKKGLVETELKTIAITRQCELLELNRSTLYYEAKPISEADQNIMQRIDEIYTDISSTYGYRFMHRQLIEDGFEIGVNKLHRLMNKMGIQAIFPKKRRLTSLKHQEHKIYPYFLRGTDGNYAKQRMAWRYHLYSHQRRTYVPGLYYELAQQEHSCLEALFDDGYHPGHRCTQRSH